MHSVRDRVRVLGLACVLVLALLGSAHAQSDPTLGADSATVTQVTELYVAQFGRAPDAQGLQFWISKLQSGAIPDMISLAERMFATNAARAQFPEGLSNQGIVRRFYRNTLGRDPDSEGLRFWTNRLDAAQGEVGPVIKTMIDTVRGFDPANIADPQLAAEGQTSKSLFNNKIAVAEYFAVDGPGDVAGAEVALDAVTANSDTSGDSAIEQVLVASGAVDSLDISPIQNMALDAEVANQRVTFNDAILNNAVEFELKIDLPGLNISYNHLTHNIKVDPLNSTPGNYNVSLVVNSLVGSGQDTEAFKISIKNVVSVMDTYGLRSALSSASKNGFDDVILIQDGIYKTTDDAGGPFIFICQDSTSISLVGTSKKNAILSGGNQDQIFNHNKIDSNECNLRVERISFIDGASESAGGAMSVNNGYLSIDSVSFRGNHTEHQGGALYSGSSGSVRTTEIKNSIFTNNSALAAGGAIRIFGMADSVISNAIFKGNNTRQYDGGVSGGGAIYASGSGDLVITDSRFESNQSAHSGGAIRTGSLTGSGLEFVGNIADGSGGSLSAARGRITRSQFDGNSCSGACYGGGISFGGDVFSSIFINNQGGNHASYPERTSGLWVTGHLVNNLIINNNPGIVTNGATFVNNIIYGNTTFDIKTINKGVSEVKYNYIDIFRVDGPTLESNNVFNGYKLGFVDEPNGDYHLTGSSNLIDTGQPSIQNLDIPEFDFDGGPRTNGVSIDIGPFEF